MQSPLKTTGRRSRKFHSACLLASVTAAFNKGKAILRERVIADWLLRLTQMHKGWGLCYLYLRNVKHHCWHHKRVYRIYRELELNLRIKPRKRINRDKSDALHTAIAINQVWSMDFMSDALSDRQSTENV